MNLSRAPGPKGVPVVGNLFAVVDNPLVTFVRSWRQFGDFVRFRFFRLDYLLVNDPDAIHHVLVENAKNYTKSRNYAGLRLILGDGLLTSEGEMWRRQRRLVQPAFHRQRLAGFATRMVASTARMLARWAAAEPRGVPMDVHAEMMRVTLHIVGETLLSADLDGDAESLGPMISVALHFVNDFVNDLVRLPTWVPTSKNRRFRASLETVDTLIQRVIDERRASGKDHGDLLSMLMSATDEGTHEGMSDRQLRDELVTLVLAGHETTANALSWTFYLLSLHPAVEARLAREVRAVLGDRAPTVEDLPKLHYARMVLEESMRLFPPAWAFEREAIADDVVAGYEVPKGTVIGIAPYTMHRHPKYWPNPEGFDPDRFAPENVEGRPRYTYLPFGAGPRLCIGNAFAMMEAQIILAMVVQRWRLLLVPGHVVTPEPIVTLRPKNGIYVTLSPRAAS